MGHSSGVLGGQDENRQSVKVAGAGWEPRGVCSDNRGRLYVADSSEYNKRIIVLSAASGSVLQVVQGRGHWKEGRYTNECAWVNDPGITVYGPDIKYKDDEPKQGVESGTVLQEIKHQHLYQHGFLCWNELSTVDQLNFAARKFRGFGPF